MTWVLSVGFTTRFLRQNVPFAVALIPQRRGDVVSDSPLRPRVRSSESGNLGASLGITTARELPIANELSPRERSDLPDHFRELTARVSRGLPSVTWHTTGYYSPRRHAGIPRASELSQEAVKRLDCDHSDRSQLHIITSIYLAASLPSKMAERGRVQFPNPDSFQLNFYARQS